MKNSTTATHTRQDFGIDKVESNHEIPVLAVSHNKHTLSSTEQAKLDAAMLSALAILRSHEQTAAEVEVQR